MPKPFDPKFRIPRAFRLRHSFDGHKAPICAARWTSDGHRLLTASCDRSIIVWDVESQRPLRRLNEHHDIVTDLAIAKDNSLAVSSSDDQRLVVWDLVRLEKIGELLGHEGHVNSVAITPDGSHVISASDDTMLKLWSIEHLKLVGTFAGHDAIVYSVTITPDGRRVVSASRDQTLKVWDCETGTVLRTLEGHGQDVNTVIVSWDGRHIISGGDDRTVRVWDIDTGRLLRILEGHTDYVMGLAISGDGELLASKSTDDTVRIWTCSNWQEAAVLDARSGTQWPVALSFHPMSPMLAMLGERKSILNVWEVDPTELPGTRQRNVGTTATDDLLSRSTGTYSCAKVVLLGDTGVGKTGLRLVLTNLRWEKTESSHARKVELMERQDVKAMDNGTESHETRDIWLWDLAGQPGYRLIHQLHLNEVVIAVVVFDSRSETDPFAGVIHWDRALRQAQRLRPQASSRVKKFLVAARTDREGVSVSQERVEKLMRELDFDEYFQTSAKEGWEIPKLAEAIRQAIDWDALPKVTSTPFLHRIRAFFEATATGGQVLTTSSDLFRAFLEHERLPPETTEEAWRNYETCLVHVENEGLLRRLSFGNLILLRPELLDAYASSLVNAAKAEPEGTGAIAEDDARLGRFWISEEERIADREQEKLLLIATIEDLVRYELALREHTEEGPFLVFPSQYTRELPEAPDLVGKAIVFAFDGPLASIYTTLVVRLARSQLFTKDELWKNAATYRTKSSGICGLYLNEVSEGHGEIVVFFKDIHSADVRLYFEEFVRSHLERRAITGTVVPRTYVVCPECGTPVSDIALKRRLERTNDNFISCNVCDTKIILRGDDEQPRDVLKVVRDMELFADRARDQDVSLTSASGETEQFDKWAGASEVLLAVVYTQVARHAEMAGEIGLEKMKKLHRHHFHRARSLVEILDGCKVKSLQHAALYAFRSAPKALDFARSLHREPGDDSMRLTIAIDVGVVHIEEGDALGRPVDVAIAIAHDAAQEGIWLSDNAKTDLDELKAEEHESLEWTQHPDHRLTGFPKKCRLWHLEREHQPSSRRPSTVRGNFLDAIPDLRELDGYADDQLDHQLHALCDEFSQRAQGFPSLDSSRFKSTKRPGKINAIRLLVYFARNISELLDIARDPNFVANKIHGGTFGRNHVHRTTGISTGGISSNPAWHWLMNSVFKIRHRRRGEFSDVVQGKSDSAADGPKSSRPDEDYRENQPDDDLMRREEAHELLDQLEAAERISPKDLEQMRAWVNEQGGASVEHIKSYLRDLEST